MEWSEIARIISSKKNIIAFTGAGISTNSGIPDFRGKGGLYETVLAKYHLPYGEALFDLNYFGENPLPFFDFSRELAADEAEPTLCHKFLASLEQEEKLERIITQNIDRLHRRAGSRRVFQCHGTYDTGHCRKCGKAFEYSSYEDALTRGEVAYCECGGVIKPDIVFFGESLPPEFYRLWENPPGTDLLLVLGTSLSVHPAADLALRIAANSPSIIVNRDPTDYDSAFDYVIHEDLDVFAGHMIELIR